MWQQNGEKISYFIASKICYKMSNNLLQFTKSVTNCQFFCYIWRNLFHARAQNFYFYILWKRYVSTGETIYDIPILFAGLKPIWLSFYSELKKWFFSVTQKICYIVKAGKFLPKSLPDRSGVCNPQMKASIWIRHSYCPSWFLGKPTNPYCQPDFQVYFRTSIM